MGSSGGWYTYEYFITIEPNPDFESIFLSLPASANIEQLHVDTICVPEPAAAILLLAGSAMILRRRRS
jgi:hypothetical protein